MKDIEKPTPAFQQHLDTNSKRKVCTGLILHLKYLLSFLGLPTGGTSGHLTTQKLG